MKKTVLLCSAALLAGLLLNQSAHAVDTTWSNVGIDYNTATNWSNGTPTGRRDLFTTDVVLQPNLSASISAIGLFFSGNNYDITATAGAGFTFTAYGTGGSPNATNSTAAAIYSSATGTNTIEAPITLAPASTTTSSIYQSANGTLILNGAISGSGVTLNLIGGGNASPGTIQLNGANTFSGGLTINGTAETVVLGNDSAAGTGTLTVSATSNLQAGGGQRTLANSIVLAGNATVNGGNAFVINGDVTSSGSSSRTLTVSNTGGVTLNGNVFLQESAASGRTFTINGTSAVAVNGVVQDGGTGPATLKYTGSSTLTLNNTNTYSGGTQITVAGATIIANHDGALGTGNVSLTAPGVTLTLQNGLVNNYIADNANISIVTGSTLNLNFTGTDIVTSFSIDGMSVNAGVHNSTTDPNLIFGTGSLTVLTQVPEPATYMLFGIGLLACAQRFRSRSKKA